MVSKKLATRLEKKREELDGMKAKVVVLQKEVATLEQEAQVELIEQLQKKLGTDDLLAVERGADVKIMDRFFRHRKVPLPRKIFKTRISA